MGSLGPTGLGILLIVASFVLYIVGWLPTIRAVMVFLGILLLGIKGHILAWLGIAMAWLAHAFNTATAWGLGAVVPGLLAVVLIILVIYDWHPKNRASRKTYWLSAALAVLIVAGSSSVPALAHLQTGVRQGVTQTTNSVG